MINRRQFMASGSAAALALAAEPVLAKGKSMGGDARLNAVLDAVFQDGIARSPEAATSLGLDKGKLAHLRGQLSPATAAERQADLARDRRWRARVEAVNPAGLTAAGKRNRALALYMMDQRITAPARFELDSVQRPYRIFQQGGAYFRVPDFLNSQHPVTTVDDAEAYLSRLSAFAGRLDEDTAEQRAQSERGFTAPGWSLDLTLGQMAKLRGPAAADSGLVKSLADRARAKGLPGDWAARAAPSAACSMP